MRLVWRILLVGLLTSGLIGFTVPAAGQFGSLKKKVKDKVEKKAEDKVDKKLDDTIDKAAGDGEKESGEFEKAPEEKTDKPVATAKGGTATAEDMNLYTKYDFIPGDKVIFYDDLANEEMGEFPSRWKLDQGVFEIVKQHGQNWIMCTNKGAIMPKIPVGPLPPKYTVEMDFYIKGGEAKPHWYTIMWTDKEGQELGYINCTYGKNARLRIGDKDISSKDLLNPLSSGKHTMRIMATKTTIKCYIDNERTANVPAVEGFAPYGLKVWMDLWEGEPENPMLMGAFRYAEGGKTLKQQLDEEGKIVTHGILFDSGSDKIKGESYKTLADIGALLTDNPALRLSIEGHTDSDGADDANLKLSQNRSASVRTYLIDNYKIDGGRLETKGFGESKPIDVNTSAEGKANNRRVELVKL
jgi:outer membrane protein OmpA-like peptidoglycan-associated protein